MRGPQTPKGDTRISRISSSFDFPTTGSPTFPRALPIAPDSSLSEFSRESAVKMRSRIGALNARVREERGVNGRAAAAPLLGPARDSQWGRSCRWAPIFDFFSSPIYAACAVVELSAIPFAPRRRANASDRGIQIAIKKKKKTSTLDMVATGPQLIFPRGGRRRPRRSLFPIVHHFAQFCGRGGG